jgi:hypothetical protein
MLRRLRIVTAAAILGSASVILGVAQPASAHAPVGTDCGISAEGVCYFFRGSDSAPPNNVAYGGANEFVEYNDANFTDSPAMYFDYANIYNYLPDQGLGYGVFDDAGSAYNGYVSCSVTIYAEDDYKGAHLTLQGSLDGSSSESPTLGPVNNNNISQKFC